MRIAGVRAIGRRRLRRALGAVAAFLVVYPPLYAALVPERRPPLPALPEPPAGTYRLFVADWGYHTAIVVEQPRGWRLGPPGAEGAPFLEYAWGDRRFYLESDYRPHALFATLFLPTAAVLYVEGRPDPPRLGAAQAVFSRAVDAPTLRMLLAGLEGSARRGADGARSAPHGPTPGYRGRFYPAHDAYLWARDCNWWTVARLAGVGLAGAPAGVVVTPQVPGRLRGFMRLRPAS
jgi:hypothetical protein